jgi:hypothetical protein
VGSVLVYCIDVCASVLLPQEASTRCENRT